MDYTEQDFHTDLIVLSRAIKEAMARDAVYEKNLVLTGIYGIPRGGIPLAVALSQKLNLPLVKNPLDHKDGPFPFNVLVVDDLIDSGNTIKSFLTAGCPVAVLCRKERSPICPSTKFFNQPLFIARYIDNEWVKFFWEGEEGATGPEDAVVRLLEFVGEDPNREGLLDTPKRVLKAWQFLTNGYQQKVEQIVKSFDSESYNQIVLLKDIELYSMCEHHCLPFWGKAHVAYIPNGRVIGLSKLARIVDMFARRLQIQERMGEQITSAIMKTMNPQGAACIIEASHLCMRMRGVQKQNSVMVTSSLKGVFFEDEKARQELMKLIG